MLQDLTIDTAAKAVTVITTVPAQSGLAIAEHVLLTVVLPIVIVAIVFGSAFGVVYLYLRNSHRQRMLMIDKGMVEAKKAANPKRYLVSAIMVVGAAVGWALGYKIQHMLPPPFGAAGGAAAGYIAYYCIFVAKKEKKQEPE